MVYSVSPSFSGTRIARAVCNTKADEHRHSRRHICSKFYAGRQKNFHSLLWSLLQKVCEDRRTFSSCYCLFSFEKYKARKTRDQETSGTLTVLSKLAKTADATTQTRAVFKFISFTFSRIALAVFGPSTLRSPFPSTSQSPA